MDDQILKAARVVLLGAIYLVLFWCLGAHAQVNITQYRLNYASGTFTFDTGWTNDLSKAGNDMANYLSSIKPTCQSPGYNTVSYQYKGVVGTTAQFDRTSKSYSTACTNMVQSITLFTLPVQTQTILGCPAGTTVPVEAFVCYTPGAKLITAVNTSDCDDAAKVPVGTTRYTHTAQEFGTCVVTLGTLQSISRKPGDETEYWRGTWGAYTASTTGELPSQFNPEPPIIPQQYARPANPNPTDPTDPNPTDPGPGLDWGSFSGPDGTLYSGKGHTFQSVIETRKPQLLATPIVAAMSTFFTMTHEGQCMPWGLPANDYITVSVTFDFHCSDTAQSMFLLMRAAVLLGAAFYAFRIAIE